MEKKISENDEEELLSKNIKYILEDKVIKSEELNENFYILEKNFIELTFQKEILELNENIVEICLLYIELII